MTAQNNTTSRKLGREGLAALAAKYSSTPPEVVYIRDFSEEPARHPKPNLPFMYRPVAADPETGEDIPNMGLAYPWEVAAWYKSCEEKGIDFETVKWRYKRLLGDLLFDADGNPLLNSEGKQKRAAGKLIFELAE